MIISSYLRLMRFSGCRIFIRGNNDNKNKNHTISVNLQYVQYCFKWVRRKIQPHRPETLHFFRNTTNKLLRCIILSAVPLIVRLWTGWTGWTEDYDWLKFGTKQNPEQSQSQVNKEDRTGQDRIEYHPVAIHPSIIHPSIHQSVQFNSGKGQDRRDETRRYIKSALLFWSDLI